MLFRSKKTALVALHNKIVLSDRGVFACPAIWRERVNRRIRALIIPYRLFANMGIHPSSLYALSYPLAIRLVVFIYPLFSVACDNKRFTQCFLQRLVVCKQIFPIPSSLGKHPTHQKDNTNRSTSITKRGIFS